MKYLILLCDGMAGEPLAELAGATTMAAAHKPHMEQLAGSAELGLAQMVPPGMEPGSDTANLAVLGYDPRRYYTGRSPLEALSIGAPMSATDVSLRMNLVTLSEAEAYPAKTILDHSAGEITTAEAGALLADLQSGLQTAGYSFYQGTSYRHLVVIKDGRVSALTPPHDILNREIGAFLPADPLLRALMEKSYTLLEHHPVNEARRRQDKNVANSVWFWGAGHRPSLPSFTAQTGLRGVMISAVDLLKGIALGAGLAVREVPGATGTLDTNYEGKAQAAARALLAENYDFAYIHVEAPDECGHQGQTREKIQAIEAIDTRLLGPLLAELRDAKEEFRLLVLPDHPTPIARRTHTGDPVPFLLYDSRCPAAPPAPFTEAAAAAAGRFYPDGYQLIYQLLRS